MQFNFVSILLFVSRPIIKEYWFKIFSCQFEITRKTIRKPLNIAIWYEEDLVRSYNWNILGESWNEYLCIKLDLCFACGKLIHERMIKASVAFWLYFDESFCFFFLRSPKTNSRIIRLCWNVCTLWMYCFIWVTLTESVVKN